MVYLIRHGQTDWNVEKKTQGQTDIALNENGRRQAVELSNRIKNLNVSRIFASDLLRAKETAEIINLKFNKEIILDKRLREINYGVLEGICRESLTTDIWDTFNFSPEKLNAEPKAKVFERVKNFFDEIKNSNENILIITHGGILRIVMYYLYNAEEFNNEVYLSKFNSCKINNIDIFEVDINNKSIKTYKN